MANAKPWMTSYDLIQSVKRKIALPIAQNTFTESEILDFANEEMASDMVPAVAEVHEEYFVFREIVDVIPTQDRYAIPERAMGMKLRDVKWIDSSGNYNDMTRVPAEDKAFWQNGVGLSDILGKYYLEGNDLVLLPPDARWQNLQLAFYYFIRPNQLVDIKRACTILSFINTITVLNSNIFAGDNITISGEVFTATNGQSVLSNTVGNPTSIISTAAPHGLITGQSITVVGSTTSTPSLDGTYIVTVLSPTTFSVPFACTVAGTDGSFFLTDNEFLIGSSDIETATNLTVSVNNNGIVNANNGTPSTSLVTLRFSNIKQSQQTTVSNPSAFILPADTQTIEFDQVPSTYQDPTTFVTSVLFVDGVTVDFLQTRPGHQTRAIDVLIPKNGISGTFIGFNLESVPTSTVVGDYICLSYECIIPQIPPDLHTQLAERTGAKILQSLGDMAGMQASMAKVQDMEKNNFTLLDNRVESSPQKIVGRNSLLRWQKSSRYYRRW